jgi:hypothetical protein
VLLGFTGATMSVRAPAVPSNGRSKNVAQHRHLEEFSENTVTLPSNRSECCKYGDRKNSMCVRSPLPGGRYALQSVARLESHVRGQATRDTAQTTALLRCKNRTNEKLLGPPPHGAKSNCDGTEQLASGTQIADQPSPVFYLKLLSIGEMMDQSEMQVRAKRQVAIHEAGRLVVAKMLGFAVPEASLIESDAATLEDWKLPEGVPRQLVSAAGLAAELFAERSDITAEEIVQLLEDGLAELSSTDRAGLPNGEEELVVVFDEVLSVLRDSRRLLTWTSGGLRDGEIITDEMVEAYLQGES